MRERVEKSEASLALLELSSKARLASDFSTLSGISASRMVSMSNYCICRLFFISNLMKSSVVYAAI